MSATDKKLRVGVIGLGMGRGHVKNFAKHPSCEVVAIADINLEGAEATARRIADAIELLRKVDTLLLDKTGTVTEGRPELTDLVTTAGFEDDEVLSGVGGAARAAAKSLRQPVRPQAPCGSSRGFPRCRNAADCGNLPADRPVQLPVGC